MLKEYGKYYKVFLDVDYALSSPSECLFGKEWDEVRRQQTVFLLERPLMFKVLAEKRSGPARLNSLFQKEFWEAEQEWRRQNKKPQIEELADMAIILLTFDCFNPGLSLPSQITVMKDGLDTIAGYCKELEIDIKDLISPAKKKVEINKTRNPKEAFMLMQDEPMQMSTERMEHNWSTLKKRRNKHLGWFDDKGKDWWKKWLRVDKNGWVCEKVN